MISLNIMNVSCYPYNGSTHLFIFILFYKPRTHPQHPGVIASLRLCYTYYQVQNGFLWNKKFFDKTLLLHKVNMIQFCQSWLIIRGMTSDRQNVAFEDDEHSLHCLSFFRFIILSILQLRASLHVDFCPWLEPSS